MISKPRIFVLDTKIAGPEGSLSVIEGERDIPFKIKRIFYVYGVESGRMRGAHAHYAMHEVVVCVNGVVTVKLVLPGSYSEQVVLDHPSTALYIPPAAWRTIQFGPGAVLLALASTHYEEADYLRDYTKYETYIKSLSHQEGV